MHEATDEQPIKRPDCGHQEDNERCCKAVVRNSYHCEECDERWEDDWSCGCDDECPSCGADISPHESEEIDEPCACAYLGC